MNRTRAFVGMAVAAGAARAWDIAFCEDRLGRRRLDRTNAARLAELADTPVVHEDAVFLGDGFIARGNWHHVSASVKNFGLFGDRSDELVGRIDHILVARPAHIVLSIGTHDLDSGRSEAQTVKGIVAAFDHIIEGSPDTKLTVTTLAPRRDRYARSVPAINAQIRRTAALRDLGVIDIYEPLAGPNGKLPTHLSIDKVHLRAEAYDLLYPSFRASECGSRETS